MNYVMQPFFTAHCSAVAVAGHSSGFWFLSAFGENWRKDGFCVSFKETAFNTHALCFYIDTVCSLIMWLLWRRCDQSRSEFKILKNNIASVFFHGCAHLFIYFQGDMGAADVATLDTTEMIVYYAIVVPFWMSFTFGMTKQPFLFALTQSVLHSIALHLYVTPLMSFTYVNSVIVLNLVLDVIINNPVDSFSGLEAFVAAGPVFAVTFLEPLTCDSFLVDFGGHAWFDFSIPAGTFIYYYVCRNWPRRVNKAANKLE
jgi:hypothetical protein